MNCVADDRLRVPGEEPFPAPSSHPREAAIQYLRAASCSADGPERESLRRRAADLILPRDRRSGADDKRINRG